MTPRPTPRQMFRPRYSGPLSKAFWAEITEVEDGTLAIYQLGCILQEVEVRVLKALSDARAIRASAKENAK